MLKVKLNISYESFTLKRIFVTEFLRKCITAALSQQGVDVPCEINVLVTDNKGIQAINKASRNIDAPTDVLSFPMFTFQPGELPDDWEEFTDPETGLCPLGDMAISVERAAEQARQFDHSLRREIGYLTVHSVLHLLGYDHLDEGPQKAQMRQEEEKIIAAIPGMQR